MPVSGFLLSCPRWRGRAIPLNRSKRAYLSQSAVEDIISSCGEERVSRCGKYGPMNKPKCRFFSHLIGTGIFVVSSLAGLEAQTKPPIPNASTQYLPPAASVFDPQPRHPVKPKSIEQILHDIRVQDQLQERHTAKKDLGEKNIAFLSGATRVQVFQVRYARGPQDDALPKLGNCVIISTGKEQGKEFARQLISTLTEDHIYRSGGSLCFNPHVAFRAWNGNSYADVLICFQCGNVQIHFSDGQHDVGASTFNLRHPSFVDLAKVAFPDDSSIQSLNSVLITDRRALKP